MSLDVLVPTRNRPAELAVTLSGLAAQDHGFGVVVSDQSDGAPAGAHPAVAGLVRNLLHLTERLHLAPGQWRAYKVAWIGACVLYDRAALVAAGGYDFWSRVPANHAGEDVAAQLRVLARAGGAGIVPSGAYHLESPTTVPDRDMECFDESAVAEELAGGL